MSYNDYKAYIETLNGFRIISYILIIIFISAKIFATYNVISKSTEKRDLNSTKSLLSFITIITGCIILLSPLFSFIKVRTYKVVNFTGYDILFKEASDIIEAFESNALWPLISLDIIILCGISTIFSGVKSYFLEDEVYLVNNMGNICGSAFFSFIYMVIGIVFYIVIKNYMDGLGKLSTATYLPFVVCVAGAIVYNIVKKNNMHINIKNEKSKSENLDKFAELKQYKSLLDDGIISQEEFDNKKMQILYGQNTDEKDLQNFSQNTEKSNKDTTKNAEKGVVLNNVIYQLTENNTYSVVGFLENAKIDEHGNCNYIIVESIQDIPVTSIESYAFFNCLNLKSITITKNIVSIKESAFQGCDNLANAYFEIAIGWEIILNDIPFSNNLEYILSNPSIAAEHLKSKYSRNIWKRG